MTTPPPMGLFLSSLEQRQPKRERRQRGLLSPNFPVSDRRTPDRGRAGNPREGHRRLQAIASQAAGAGGNSAVRDGSNCCLEVPQRQLKLFFEQASVAAAALCDLVVHER